MYCPHCGEGSTFGLKFCKKCGEALTSTSDSAQDHSRSRWGWNNHQTGWNNHQGNWNKMAGSSWAIALATTGITLGGIGLVFDFVSKLLRPAYNGQPPPGDATMIAVIMLVFGSLTVLTSAVLLIRLFSKFLLSSDHKQQQNERSDKTDDARYAPPQLQSHLPSAMSVTEHTTRNFEQKSRQAAVHD